MRGRRRANFLFWSNRTPRPGPKGSCNKVIQLSDFHQICILGFFGFVGFFFFFLNMSKCNPLQHSKKKNLIQKLYAKQSNLSVPRKDLYTSCAISFRSSEAALKNRKKTTSTKYVSNVNQKVHKSQYYHCMLENTKEQDAKLSPASPAEGMAGHQHPNALWFAAGMDFEASSCQAGVWCHNFDLTLLVLTSWGCFHAQSQWKHPRSCSNIWRLNCLTLFIRLRLIQTRFLDKCCYKWIKRTTKCK